MSRIDPLARQLVGAGVSGITPRAAAAMLRHADLVWAEAGRVLCEEGAIGRQAFVIVDGLAEVVVAGERVATLAAGSFAGEVSLLDHQPRTATVRAVTPMRLLVIGPREFGSMVREPGVARAMAVQLARRLREVETGAATESRNSPCGSLRAVAAR